MKNSDPQRQAENQLAELLTQLDEEHLRKKIDAPIDRAVAEYSFPSKLPGSYRELIHHLSGLVQHIFTVGLSSPIGGTEDQLCANNGL